MTPVLAQRLRADRSFERIYRNHVGDVYRYALGVLGDSFGAEDVTRTIFLNAFCTFRYQGGPPPSLNSLLAVAHGVCRVREAEILAVSVSDVEALISRSRKERRENLERSLTCQKAELALSRQLDDRVSRKEKRLLRAHLQLCEDCEAAARCQERQRIALRALAAIPLPPTLESSSGAQVSACGLAEASPG